MIANANGEELCVGALESTERVEEILGPVRKDSRQGPLCSDDYTRFIVLGIVPHNTDIKPETFPRRLRGAI